MIYPRVSSQTPTIVQGIAGPQGRRHALLMRNYGTNIVGGIAPGGIADDVSGLPIFQSCAEAVAETYAEACVAIVRPEFAADAVLEAAESGIQVIVSVSDGMPVHDTMRVMRRIHDLGTTWIGPSSPGIAIPAASAKLGWIPDSALKPGRFGLMSRSDTLSFQVGRRMTACGLGQSVWVGVGGDLVKGARFADLVPFFAQDEETTAIIVIGETGGTEEQELAEALRDQRFPKPVFALLAGRSVPDDVAMGLGGAPVRRQTDGIDDKIAVLERAGANVYNSIGDLIEALQTAA